VTRIGDHEISVAPKTAISATIAHFKLCPGLDAKIDRALEAGQYYNRSMEYAFLETATRLLGAESLITWETRRFDGPDSLKSAGLMGRRPNQTR